MDESKIMSDFDEEKYIDAFCMQQKCTECFGVDYSGEPNGYGCDGLENRIDRMYQSILKRRMKKIGGSFA